MLTRQWFRGATPIADATGTTYTTVAADLGRSHSRSQAPSLDTPLSRSRRRDRRGQVRDDGDGQRQGREAQGDAYDHGQGHRYDGEAHRQSHDQAWQQDAQDSHSQVGQVINVTGQKKGIEKYTITYLGDSKFTTKTTTKTVKLK